MQEIPSFPVASNHLTEDEVKRRFMPFLRDFYKNRYEPMHNTVSAEIDNVSKEGWIADGKITFRKSDGSPFVCTYEATSRDKSEEVKYQLNVLYLLWDCAAFGLVAAAFAYVFFFQTDYLWLTGLKAIGNIGLLLGIGMIGFFAWYFLVKGWRKYRYIYAIQQFKQYFADEQWVAIAEDVFPAPNDPYLLELRNQCVYNGIGLAVVPKEGAVRKIIDPSRLGIFGKDRKMTQWVTRADWYQSLSQNVEKMAARRPKAPDALSVYWNRLFRPVHYLLLDPIKRSFRRILGKPASQGAEVYTRFMSAQGVQKWIALLAFVVITPLFWRVVTYGDASVYDLEGLELRPNGKNPEDQRGFLLEETPPPPDGQPTGVTKQYPIAKNKKFEEEENEINLSGDDDSEEAYAGPEDPQPVSGDGCAALQNKRGWIVQDNTFTEKSDAMARAEEIDRRGISSDWAAQRCIAEGKSGWLVWIGKPYPTEAAAQTAADGFVKAFQRYGLKNGRFLVKKLR